MTGSEDPDREYLDGVERGAGCTEVWERLSEHRNEGPEVDD